MRSARAASSPLFAATFVFAAAANAEPVDPALPGVVTIGTPKSPAAVERLDRERRGRSSVELFDRFIEAQRKTLGSVQHAPVVHPDRGLVVALSSPEVVRLAPDGTEKFRVHLGSSPAIRSPVILPSGGVAVLTGAPSVVFISDSGKIAATIALPRAAFGVQSPSMGFVEGVASIVPTLDGSVVVAANRSLLEVDSSARVRLKVSLPERLAADVIPLDGGWIAVGESGSVYRVAPPAEPRKVGGLGFFTPGTVALLDERTLVASAPPNRIVALDLKSGTAVTRVGDSIFSFFDAPPAFAADGSAWVTTGEGFLVGYDEAGVEIGRSAAERSAVLPGGATFPMMPHRPHHNPGIVRPAPVVDEKGRVAFARGNGRFGVRDSEGKVTTTDRSCSTPLAIVPTAPGAVVLTCRDGTLIFYEAQTAESE